MKFKLLTGDHQQDGVIYKKGDVIETPLDLKKMFVNKFEEIATPPPPPATTGNEPSPDKKPTGGKKDGEKGK